MGAIKMTVRDCILSMFPEEEKVPKELLCNIPLKQKQYLINGELRNWVGPTQEVLSPICTKASSGLSQKSVGTYPLLTGKESLEALSAAVSAYNGGIGPWPTMSVSDRIEHIEDFTYRMIEKKKEVVTLIMWEVGKSLQDSEKEFDRTVDYLRDTIHALKELDRVSSRFVIEQGVIGQIRRAPLGVVLCMGPFNYPLNETFTTLIPALIMGNTVILKPPKLGVLLYYPLLEAFQKSFPQGVINTVYGKGEEVVAPLMSSGMIDVLAFIGSSRVADLLKKQHPKLHRLRCVLGLEAKNAAIILPDADLDLTVRECVLGTLSYNGQRCTALKILFVHSRIVQPFLEQFSAAIGELKFGMPWEKGVVITPLPEPHKTEYLTELLKDAELLGARVVNEVGGIVNHTFFAPAIVYPVNSKMKLYHQEQFGPIIPVVPFDDIKAPVKYIMDSNYGQQVSVFGTDENVIASLIDPLVNQVCRVNINSQCQRGPDTFPFTGRKDSAEGTLSVSDALRVFSIRTLVATKETKVNKQIITKIVREHKSNFLSTDFVL